MWIRDLSSIIAQGMMYPSAQVIRINADSVGFQRVTFRSCVAGSGASFSCYMLYLIAGHFFVEIGDVLEEFYDFL